MADWFNLSSASDESVTETHNSTLEPTRIGPPTLTTTAAIKASVLTAMAVASIIGNVVTIFLSERKRHRTQPVSIQGTTSSLYTLLFQLAISDSDHGKALSQWNSFFPMIQLLNNAKIIFHKIDMGSKITKVGF